MDYYVLVTSSVPRSAGQQTDRNNRVRQAVNKSERAANDSGNSLFINNVLPHVPCG